MNNWFLSTFLGNDAIMGYILSTVITAAIGWGAVLATKYLGVTIDEKRKQDWHSALLSAARALVAKYGVTTGDTPKTIMAAQVQDVIQEAKKSVPQAVKHFGLDKPSAAMSDVSRTIATAKIVQAINETKMADNAIMFKPAKEFTGPVDRQLG